MPARVARPDSVFRAIADPTRRAILARLALGEAPAGTLADGFRVSRPAVSRHIRVLRSARLVTEQRSGRNRVYALHPESLRVIDEWLDSYRPFWTGRLAELKRHVESNRKR